MKLQVSPNNITLLPENSADRLMVGIIDLVNSYQSAKTTLAIPDTSQPQVVSSVNNLANVISSLNSVITKELLTPVPETTQTPNG